jgi:hypothetical protein
MEPNATAQHRRASAGLTGAERRRAEGDLTPSVGSAGSGVTGGRRRLKDDNSAFTSELAAVIF